MKIIDTDLEYTENDEIALDYFLGGDTESKEDWAKRVWNNCKLHSEGVFVSSVYNSKSGQTWQERANELWDNKKNRRRESVTLQFKKENSDAGLQEIKNDPKYKTKQQRYDEENI